MSFRDYKLKPQAAQETLAAQTIEGKRNRLNEAARLGSDPLIRAVFDAAYYQGLSGEDTMTWLAYEALISRQDLMDRILNDAMMSPVPPMILIKDNEGSAT